MKISRHSGLFNWSLRATGPVLTALPAFLEIILLNVYQAIVNFRFTEYKSRPVLLNFAEDYYFSLTCCFAIA